MSRERMGEISLKSYRVQVVITHTIDSRKYVEYRLGKRRGWGGG